MRRTVEEFNLIKVIYIGLFTVVNFGVNKQSKKPMSLDSENRQGKQRTKSSFGHDASVPFI